MYSKSFYITDPVGNNAFSFDERAYKQLFVPSLKKITSFDQIELWQETAFEDVTLEWELQSYTGLKNFYEIDWTPGWNPPPSSGHLPPDKGEGISKKIFLFDNHNHAYFFWYLARERWYISDNNTLIHVDEHADTRDPWEYLMKPDSQDLQKVFHATNYIYNVGNYIIPAQKEGIIDDIIQVRSEYELKEYMSNYALPHPPTPSPAGEGEQKISNDLRQNWESGTILNLDLDFFQPDLDDIDYDMKKQVVLDAATKADVITVATSPFFIDQELALQVFRDIFWEKFD